MKHKIGLALNAISLISLVVVFALLAVGAIQLLVSALVVFAEQLRENPLTIIFTIIPVVVLAVVYSLATDFKDIRQEIENDEPL